MASINLGKRKVEQHFQTNHFAILKVLWKRMSMNEQNVMFITGKYMASPHVSTVVVNTLMQQQ